MQIERALTIHSCKRASNIQRRRLYGCAVRAVKRDRWQCQPGPRARRSGYATIHGQRAGTAQRCRLRTRFLCDNPLRFLYATYILIRKQADGSSHRRKGDKTMARKKQVLKNEPVSRRIYADGFELGINRLTLCCGHVDMTINIWQQFETRACRECNTRAVQL